MTHSVLSKLSLCWKRAECERIFCTSFEAALRNSLSEKKCPKKQVMFDTFFSQRQDRVGILKKTWVRILVTTSRSLRGHEDAFLLLLRRQRKERERREKERSSWWNMIPTWTIAYKNFPVLKTFRLCKPLIRLEFHTNSHGNWARIETPC